VVTVELALALRAAGLRWSPAPGDRFVLPHREMDKDVFVLSEMTVEVHDFPNGAVIGFNGVTEWALDSVEKDDALWLPSEDQLRQRLAGMFVRLEAVPARLPEVASADPASPEGANGAGRRYAVTIRTPDGERAFTETEPAQAYGRALLSVLTELTGTTSSGTLRSRPG
jgi:hypothetical protein